MIRKVYRTLIIVILRFRYKNLVLSLKIAFAVRCIRQIRSFVEKKTFDEIHKEYKFYLNSGAEKLVSRMLDLLFKLISKRKDLIHTKKMAANILRKFI